MKMKKRKCKNCGAHFQKVRPLDFACSIKCAIEWGRKVTRKRIEKEGREETKAQKEMLKTLGDYEKEARREFQRWIRLRDKNETCISCGDPTDKIDAGHYLKAELYSGLIFHPENVHRQCKRCNHRLHGNEINYRIGLIQRIGEDRVRWLEENKDRLRVYKYTKQELIDIKNNYKQKIKTLNKSE